MTGFLALVLAGAALSGCGGGGSTRTGLTGEQVTAGRPCPGASSCPYTRVAALGRRAEGVLRAPEAIAIARNGDVLVGDQFSHVVQRFSATGDFRDEWGSYGSGPGQFGAVSGLATDAAGNVYALDSTHDRIEKFDPSGRLLGMWGGAGRAVGQFRFGAGLGPDMPPGGGIAVAGAYVYVSDTLNDRVQRFRSDGSGATIWAGRGSGTTSLSSPRGLLASGGVLYVADDHDQRVVALDSRGRSIGQIGESGLPGGWADPYAIAQSGADIFVVDDNGGRIVELTRTLRYVRSFAGAGRYRLSKYIRAIASDRSGHLYVTDTGHYRISVFDTSGRWLRSWGISGNAAGQFSAPLGVATDRQGRILVIQTYGSRSPIYVFNSTLAHLSTWYRGGGTIIGRNWFSPTAASVAADGSVWVTDRRNDIVRHLSATGQFLGALGSRPGQPTLRAPAGVAAGPRGVVYVADTGHGRVEKYSGTGRLLGSFGGAGPRGHLISPAAVAVGPDGQVFLVDSATDLVTEMHRDGRVIRQWGGAGSSQGRFRNPSGIAVDAGGHVFVSDSGNNRVQRFSGRGTFELSWGTLGTRLGAFNSPTGVSVDCAGQVLVADTRNNRVQLFSHAAAACPGGRS